MQHHLVFMPNHIDKETPTMGDAPRLADAKKPTCKHCADGVPVIDGEHWIVKSVAKARIKIAPCKKEKSNEQR